MAELADTGCVARCLGGVVSSEVVALRFCACGVAGAGPLGISTTGVGISVSLRSGLMGVARSERRSVRSRLSLLQLPLSVLFGEVDPLRGRRRRVRRGCGRRRLRVNGLGEYGSDGTVASSSFVVHAFAVASSFVVASLVVCSAVAFRSMVRVEVDVHVGVRHLAHVGAIAVDLLPSVLLRGVDVDHGAAQLRSEDVVLLVLHR